MAKKRISFEIPTSSNECFLISCQVADELSNGKTLKDLFDIKDELKENGAWWILSKVEKNHKVKLMWKWITTKTVYITISFAQGSERNTLIVLDGQVFIIFDFFGLLEKPLNLLKEALLIKANLAPK